MKISHILAAALTVSTICSCSIISPKKTGISGASATQVNTTTENKNTDVNTSDIINLINGEWLITSANGKTIPSSDEMPYITFEQKTNRFYASNGCNILNGSYKISSDGKLKLENVLSTLKLCPDVEYEAAISAALSEAETITVKIDKIGHESYLKFYNQKGSELMTARKHNMDFLNGNWQITSVSGKTVDNDEATVFIDINELKVHGNTGCNYFNGEIFINPDKSNAIDFSNLASTRMMCPNIEQEAAILLALEETASAIQGSDNRVMLLNASGKELMTLKSIPLPKDE